MNNLPVCTLCCVCHLCCVIMFWMDFISSLFTELHKVTYSFKNDIQEIIMQYNAISKFSVLESPLE